MKDWGNAMAIELAYRYSFSSTTVTPPPPWSGGAGVSAPPAGAAQVPGNAPAQLTRAVAVDHAARSAGRSAASRRGTARPGRAPRPPCSRSRCSSLGEPSRGCSCTLTLHVAPAGGAAAPEHAQLAHAARACACRGRPPPPCRRAAHDRRPRARGRRPPRGRRPTAARAGPPGPAPARRARRRNRARRRPRAPARASARAAPGVAGRIGGLSPRARGRPRRRSVRRLLLQVAMTPSISRARLAHPLVQLARSAAAPDVSSRCASGLLARRTRASAVVERLPLARRRSRRSCSSARRSWSIFARCSASCASRALRLLARGRDDRRTQTEPRGDLQRQAAARRAVDEPVGRRERRRGRSRTPRTPRPAVVDA